MKSQLIYSSLLLLSAQTFATDSLSFKEAHNQYQQAVDAADNVNAKKYAQIAYELGRVKYGKGSKNTANLALNYAEQLSHDNKDESQTKEALYQLATDVLLKHGDTGEQINALIMQASGTKNSGVAKERLADAEDLMQDNHQEPFSLGKFYLDAGQILINAPDNHSRAIQYFKKADEILSEHAPENSIDRVMANIYLAKIDQGRRKYNSAIERYNSVIKVFDDNLDFDHEYELHAHSSLVNLYERKGESEQATKHCLAIAKMVPWKETQDQTPLYRLHPNYPKNAARRGKEGWVQFSFSITPSGFVSDIELLKFEGHKEFVKESKKALEKWRYAPKFVDGKAVKATDLSVQLDFKLSKI